MELKEILQNSGFRFNKALGQNFITDKNLLSSIVTDAEVTSEDIIVEIGTGAGTLTRALAQKAKKVFSFELDRNLVPVLANTLSGLDNVEVVYRDVLKMDDKELVDIVGKDFKVVANLPYYVTTPMLLRFLMSTLCPKSITIMVQEEVAERFAATASSKEYSSISATISILADAEITRRVSRKLFYPAPQVDSAVVKISPRAKYPKEDAAKAISLVKLAFLMRRKTLYNNLKNTYSKDMILSAFEELSLPEDIRGERLTPDDFVSLARLLS